MDLEIIIPIYNPPKGWANNIELSLASIARVFHDVSYSLVIVNDGSTIKFDQVEVERLLSTYPALIILDYEQNRGKGFAVRHGMSRSKARYVIYTDWDFPFGFDSLRDIYMQLSTGKTSLVIGTRERKYFDMLPPRRRFISKALRFTNAVITRFRVSDTQAGIKGFDSKAKEIMLTTRVDTFVFEIEFILKFLKQNDSYSFIIVTPRSNIHFSDFGNNIIRREIRSYLKLLFSA